MTLPNGEDWLWRPVMANKLDPIHLIDGTVDLEFIATLNDAIFINEENKRMAEEVATRRRGY